MSDKVILSRTTPHISAQKFHADKAPTLIRWGDDWIEYRKGAYRIVEDEVIESRVNAYMIKARVKTQSESKEDPTVTLTETAPFNPQPADVNKVVQQLIWQYQQERADFEPPCFLPGIGPEFDGVKPGNLISCQNCIVDITTGKRYDSTDRFLTFTALPINYDPEATCKGWLAFLDEVFAYDPQLIRLTQQMFGLLISDDTSYQKIFYLRGRPRAGKGTMMRVMDDLIGKDNISNNTISDIAERSGRESLLGKSLLKVTDMNTDNKNDLSQACSIMNAISGEDTVYIFRKYKSALNVRLPARIVLAGNTFPDFGDHAAALAARLELLPFDQSFANKQDRKLGEKLRAELAGILNWAIQGYADLQANGLVQSEASERAKNDVLNSGNPVWGFVKEECYLVPEAQCAKDEVFERYKSFCKAIGATALSKNKFASKLMTSFPNYISKHRIGGDERQQIFRGLQLREDGLRIVPTITFRLDAFMLSLGIERTDPQALMRDARGLPILYNGAVDDFEA
jgi:putative DNA primase/helicase